MNIAIVRSLVYEEYTQEMLDAARQKADELGVTVAKVVEVPGVHDTPFPTERLLSKEMIDGVVVIGITIKSPTDHNGVLAYNVSKQLLELGCSHQKPIGNGIIGPEASWAEVERRTERYAKKAVRATVEVSEEMDAIEEL